VLTEYAVDHSRRRVFVRLQDPIAAPDELIALLDQQAADGAWQYAMVEDMRTVTWAPSTSVVKACVDRIEALSSAHGVRGHVAFVVSDNTALFGMLRMYSIRGEATDATIHVFRDMDAAEEWLQAVSPIPSGSVSH
jgi:hypothetical protein